MLDKAGIKERAPTNNPQAAEPGKKAAPVATSTEAMVEQPVGETPESGAQTSVDSSAAAEIGSMASQEAAPATVTPAPASVDETITRDTAVLGDDADR